MISNKKKIQASSRFSSKDAPLTTQLHGYNLHSEEAGYHNSINLTKRTYVFLLFSFIKHLVWEPVQKILFGTHNQLIFLRKINIHLYGNLPIYFDIILKIISLCVRNLLIAYVLLLVHSWMSGAGPCVDAGQAAWHQPGTGALLHLLLSECFSNEEEIRTFIFLIHVNEKKLSGDTFTAKTTSGLNNSSLSKGKLNITVLKLQPFMPTIQLFCGHYVCPTQYLLTHTPWRLPLRSSKSNTYYRYTGIQIKHLLTVEHGEIYFETILWFT